VPNHNTSSWDRSRNKKVVKSASIFIQHFRYMKLMQNEALSSINERLDQGEISNKLIEVLREKYSMRALPRLLSNTQEVENTTELWKQE